MRSDNQGRLYVSIQPNKMAAVSVLHPPAARFAVQVAADGPTTVQVLAGGRTLEADEQGAFTWDPSPAEPVGMEIRLTAGAVTRAYGLVITRPSDG